MRTLKKGEHVTCTNGHVICDLLCDLSFGGMPDTWADAFGNWRQDDRPKLGSMHQPKCAICGAPFLSAWDWGWSHHMEIDGWQPPLTPQEAEATEAS